MARYIRNIQLNRPEQFVNYIISDFLLKESLALEDFRGESVYRHGIGMLGPVQFFKYTYQNGMLHLEAWVRNAWCPGLYCGENAMTGYVGCVPKNAYKKTVESLIDALAQPVPGETQMASFVVLDECGQFMRYAPTPVNQMYMQQQFAASQQPQYMQQPVQQPYIQQPVQQPYMQQPVQPQYVQQPVQQPYTAPVQQMPPQ